MKRKDFYFIDFKKYKPGKHQIEFEITDEILDKYAFLGISSVNAKAEIEMTVSSNFLQLEININGKVKTQCGRCLQDYNQEIKYNTELTVEFGDYSDDLSEADTQIVINRKEDKLVLDKHFHDYITLAMPYNPAHPMENGKYLCNPEMLEQLKKYSAEEKKNQIDPRWDQLKNIFDNN